MKVAVGFDHAGVPFHDVVLDAVRAEGHEPVDYPDVALAAARAVVDGTVERAVVVCGSGAGVAVAACKVPGIRAACAHDTYSAAQCVEHDDCNVLCLGARVIGPIYAEHCARAFLGATFSGEERHVRRLGKVAELERRGFETPTPETPRT